MPFTVCTARNSPPTGAGLAGARSQSSSSWLQALKCSRLSARNSSAYCDRSMWSAEHALNGLEHARWLERLHDEVLRAGLDRLDDEGLLAHRAAHENLRDGPAGDRKSTRLNSSHSQISYAVFCLKKKKKKNNISAAVTCHHC